VDLDALAHVRYLIPSRRVSGRSGPLIHAPGLIGSRRRYPDGAMLKTPVDRVHGRNQIVPSQVRRIRKVNRRGYAGVRRVKITLVSQAKDSPPW
jgi:hypothetical protein